MPKRIDTLTGAWVGRGEDAAYEIFKKWYPGIEIKRWVKLSDLKIFVPWGMSQAQIKQTIDLVFKIGFITYCVRIQDESHKGIGKARGDSIQKGFIEALSMHKVIDIHEQDAPVLFSDEINQESEFEIWLNFLDQGIAVCPFCHAIGRFDNVDGKIFCDACGQECAVKFTFEYE